MTRCHGHIKCEPTSCDILMSHFFVEMRIAHSPSKTTLIDTFMLSHTLSSSHYFVSILKPSGCGNTFSSWRTFPLSELFPIDLSDSMLGLVHCHHLISHAPSGWIIVRPNKVGKMEIISCATMQKMLVNVSITYNKMDNVLRLFVCKFSLTIQTCMFPHDWSINLIRRRRHTLYKE